MSTIKKSWDLLTEEQRRKAVSDIIDFYATERDEKIGIVAAEELLDLFLQATSSYIYNKGVEDTKEFLKNGLEGLLFETEASLKK